MFLAFFSPKGSMNSTEMLRYGLILILLDVALKASSLLSGDQISSSLSALFSILVIVPWLFLWVKRYRDAGKSGSSAAWPMMLYGFLTPFVFFLAGGGKMVRAFGLASNEGLGPQDTQDLIFEMAGDPTHLALRYLVGLVGMSVLLLYGFNKTIDRHKENPEVITHPWSDTFSKMDEDSVP